MSMRIPGSILPWDGVFNPYHIELYFVGQSQHRSYPYFPFLHPFVPLVLHLCASYTSRWIYWDQS